MFTPHDYCAGCGLPHPWLSRVGALDGLILAVRRDTNLGEAEKLAAIQHLEALKALDSYEHRKHAFPMSLESSPSR